MTQISVADDPTWPGPVVGVLGGLGPAATALFLKEVVELTPAGKDQDHLDLIVLDHSTTPDRTAAILRDGPDPTESLRRDALRLKALGVDFISVPCNTAHHFLHAIEASAGVPLLSIVDVTVAAAVAHGRSIAVLATDGTRAARVYQDALEAAGASVLLPDDDQQHLVMSVIYDGVKAGGPVDVAGLRGVIDALLADGADVVVMGCTELSVVYSDEGWSADPALVDSVEELARATVLRAGRSPGRGR